jgi:hypothetical protein
MADPQEYSSASGGQTGEEAAADEPGAMKRPSAGNRPTTHLKLPSERHGDLKLLRLTLIRELETINQYQDFFDAAEDPELKELMGHLMFEEKEHVAELTELLKRYDPDQLSHFEGEHAAGIGVGHAVFGARSSVGGAMGAEADLQGAVPAGDPLRSSRPLLVPSNASPPVTDVASDAGSRRPLPLVAEPDSSGHWPALTVGSLFGQPQ